MNIEKEKKVVFYDREHNYANFKIRLRYDGITQGNFFRFLIGNYLKNNSHMLKMVEEYKINNTKIGKSKIKRTEKDFLEADSLLGRIGITKSDKTHIYDLIEDTERE